MKFSKNSPALRAAFSLENVAIAALVLMLAGFVRSRALLSLGMAVFAVNALLRGNLRAAMEDHQWMLPGLLVVLYIVSGCWSANTAVWYSSVQLKLPLLVLPLSFSLLPPFSAYVLRSFSRWLMLAMITGIAYSAACYLKDPGLYIREANHSLLIPTLAYNNHIVWSMAAALSIPWFLLVRPLWNARWQRVSDIMTALLVLYLHFLSAKTGLLLLYVFLLLWLVRLFRRRATRLRAAAGAMAAIVLIAGAYMLVPTFRGRINYTADGFRRYMAGERTGNFSDVGRMLSYEVGLRQISAAPLAGAGAGDEMASMQDGYAQLYPDVPPAQRLIPHNQFLATAVAVGLPGALLLFIWMVVAMILAVRGGKNRFYVVTVWLMLLASLFVDAMLDVQFGMFVFLLFGQLSLHVAGRRMQKVV